MSRRGGPRNSLVHVVVLSRVAGFCWTKTGEVTFLVAERTMLREVLIIHFDKTFPTFLIINCKAISQGCREVEQNAGLDILEPSSISLDG